MLIIFNTLQRPLDLIKHVLEENSKKALLISATLTDIGITLSASFLAKDNTGSGKFWTAITADGFLLPFILVKILFILTFVVLIREYFRKSAK